MDLTAFLESEPAYGTKTKLARQIGCQPQLVWQWGNRVRPAPAARCPAIERATQGRVTCEEQRPDVAWVRIPDDDWPWHPKGRPIPDIALPAAGYGVGGIAHDLISAGTTE